MKGEGSVGAEQRRIKRKTEDAEATQWHIRIYGSRRSSRILAPSEPVAQDDLRQARLFTGGELSITWPGSLLFQFVPGPLDRIAVFLVVCPVKGIPSLAFWRVVAFSFYTAKSNFSPPPTLQDLHTGSNVHCALRFRFSMLASRIYRFTTLVLMFPR